MRYPDRALDYDQLITRIQNEFTRGEPLARAESMMMEKYPTMFTPEAMARLSQEDRDRFMLKFSKTEEEMKDLNLFTVFASGFIPHHLFWKHLEPTTVDDQDNWLLALGCLEVHYIGLSQRETNLAPDGLYES